MSERERNRTTAATSAQQREERSSLQMQVRSKSPKSKRVDQNQFNGYGGDEPLKAPESRQNSRSPSSTELSRRSIHAHPWLDYPPRFENGVEKATAKLKDTLAPTGMLRVVPAELRYTLTRNFGFFARVFTQFFERDGADNVKQSIGLK